MNFLKRLFTRFHPGDHWRTADGAIVKLLTVDPIIGTLIGGNTTVRYNSKGVSYCAENNLVKKLLPEPGDVWISKYGHKIQITSSTKVKLEGMFENSGAIFRPTLENLRTLYLRNHHDSVGSQYITTTGRRIQIILNLGSQSKGVDLDTNETVIISVTGNLWSNTPDRLEKSVPTKGENMPALKVGQVWNTARGLARILRIEQGYSVAWVFGSGNGEAVRFREGPQKQEHDYLYSERLRLESLHSEPLSLEKGQRYKAANGKVGTVVNVVEETENNKPTHTLLFSVKFDDLPGWDLRLYYAGGVFKVCDSWTLVEEVKSPQVYRVGQVWETEKGLATIKQANEEGLSAYVDRYGYEVIFSEDSSGTRSACGLTMKRLISEAFPKTQENPQIFRVGEVWMTEVGTVTIKSVVGGVVKAVMAVMGNPAYGLTFSVSRAGVYKSPNGLTLKHLVSEAPPEVPPEAPPEVPPEAPPEVPLEFKVGHSYLTADGDTLKLIQKTEYLWLDGNKGTERRSLDGRYYLSNGRSSHKDLVKEAPTLKLEVGHTYTDASGALTYKVVATDAPVVGYPVVAYKHNRHSWALVGLTANGQISNRYTHVCDIVREVK